MNPDEDLHPKPSVVSLLNDLREEDAESIRQLLGMITAAGDGNQAEGIKRIRVGLIWVRRIEGFSAVTRLLILLGAGVLGAFAAFPDYMKQLSAAMLRLLSGAK